MNDEQLINLAAAPIRKKAKLFLIISSILLGIMLIAIISLVCGLEGSQDLKDSNGGLIGGIISVVIVLGVPGAIFLVLMFKQRKLLNDKDKLLKDGTKIYETREANRLEKERKQAELMASFTSDFEANKEFKGMKSIVWLNTDTKQIQFGLPSGENAKEKDKKKMLASLFNSRVTEMIVKTKILNLDDLTDIDLVHDSEKVTTSNYDSAQGGTYGYGSLKVSSSTTTFHYYQLEFKFNDLDNPVVFIYFNNDNKTAEILYQTVKLLTGK